MNDVTLLGAIILAMSSLSIVVGGLIFSAHRSIHEMWAAMLRLQDGNSQLDTERRRWIKSEFDHIHARLDRIEEQDGET